MKPESLKHVAAHALLVVECVEAVSNDVSFSLIGLELGGTFSGLKQCVSSTLCAFSSWAVIVPDLDPGLEAPRSSVKSSSVASVWN